MRTVGAVTELGTDVLGRMCDTARRLWGPGRRWTPGEITWAVLTDPDGHDVRFVGDGFVWRQADYTVILAARAEEISEAVSSVAGEAIQVADDDRVLLEVLRRAGYQALPSSPFDLDVRLATTAISAVELPAGYVVRSASPDDDLVSVHRAAWRPADLPFARGHMPAFSIDDAASSFDAAKLAAVQAADGYRADLHVVVGCARRFSRGELHRVVRSADGCRRHRTARRVRRAPQPWSRGRDVPPRRAPRPRRRWSRAGHPPAR